MGLFSLPKNSTVRPGKVYPAPEGATNVKHFEIYRYDPESGENPRLTFEVV